MGDIADMLINGELDFYTGEYIGKGSGYPRTGDGSLPWERGYKKRSGAYGGVVNFCMQKGKTLSKANKMIKRYGREVLGIETPTTIELKTYKEVVMPKMIEISNKIQQDFNTFRNWFLIQSKI